MKSRRRTRKEREEEYSQLHSVIISISERIRALGMNIPSIIESALVREGPPIQETPEGAPATEAVKTERTRDERMGTEVPWDEGGPEEFDSLIGFRTIPGLEGAADKPLHYFWININPDDWTMDDLKGNEELFYACVNKKGNRRRIFKCFLAAKPGDRILFYQKAPRKKFTSEGLKTFSETYAGNQTWLTAGHIVAAGEVINGIHEEYDAARTGDVGGITIRFLEDIEPVAWESIASIPLLQRSSPIVNKAQGNIFPLTREEYEIILSLEDVGEEGVTAPGTDGVAGLGSKPGIADEDIAGADSGIYGSYREKLTVENLKLDVSEYAKEIKITKLYFEDMDILIRRVLYALANGKHIVFYGPPGTGKSSLAKVICEKYNVAYSMVTGTSDWSTFDTIGGYLLEEDGTLKFNPGLFLRSFQTGNLPANNWLIIDEINRADIDKAFGPMFSALVGDNVTLPQKIRGEYVEIQGEPQDEDELAPHRFFIHPDWHIIATMNTFDKSALYEMSYAFMRRFSFIPVGIPDDLDMATRGLIDVWGLNVDEDIIKNLATLWKIINAQRMIGPAIIEDMLHYIMKTRDYTSSIIMFVLPQFEGQDITTLRKFLDMAGKELMGELDIKLLKREIEEFFDVTL